MLLELPRPADRGPRQIPTAPRTELFCTILTSIYLKIIGYPCVKKVYKVLGFVNVLSTLGCRPDQGRYPRQSCSAQFLPQNVFANACNSCVKDVQSVRCSRCQVFTSFYLQTWPAESAVQSECTKADSRCTLFVTVLGLIWI